MKIRDFIQENFLIDDAETGELIPFKFNSVQDKYYDLLCADYSEDNNFSGARELDYKARKEGFTSMWLAIFAAILLLVKHSSRFLEISYKDEATIQHFRRIKNFILSTYQKNPSKWSKKLENTIFASFNEGSEFVLSENRGSFYCGTANTKTAERGGTVQGVLFSEAAHYPNTGIIKAAEIIDGTKAMVKVGTGIVVQETTVNGFNFWKKTWDMARHGEISFKPRFFGWREFYTEQEYKRIYAEATDKEKVKQEYPENEMEGFISTGECYFDKNSLAEYMKQVDKTIAVY